MSTSSGGAFGPTSVKTASPPGNFCLGSAGQVKRIVERQKPAEHFGAADDGDRAVTDSEPFERLIEAGAERIPQQRIGMCRIGREGGDLTGHDEPLSPRGARSAFMRMPAVHDDGGTVERVLEEALIGLIADRIRHLAFGVGEHAVGGNDDIAFDAAHRPILEDRQVPQQ